ncbi:MAG: DNA polymerase III subunit epsilon [Hyphomicrobiaceae bacterium]|nr:DNA polymerase III subunit epsilon [Hyphomicrobiaceae bacterium]
MQREIVLDTETTGLDARRGDRLIEIGCLELVNRIPSGQEFHRFINPEDREVHPDAEAVHGISTGFLKDKPSFAAVAGDFLAFIGDAALVIHNASFDIGFINMELERAGRLPIGVERLIDTLVLARRKHPAGPNSLDALCKRYGIDNSKRVKHGALMDSALLAEVYVELLGERQARLVLGQQSAPAALAGAGGILAARPRPAPLPTRLTPDAEALHRAFVETLGQDAIWRRYMDGAREMS